MNQSIIQKIRKKSPVVHCITNIVAANDMANILLSIGAKPIMARHPGEVASITPKCDALVLNLGTPERGSLAAMYRCAAAAAKAGIPTVFDPVGVGSSKLRQKAAKKILKKVRPAVIKGNRSEIRALAQSTYNFTGVDARGEAIDADIAENLARSYGCIVVVTDKCDLVTDGTTTLSVQNGHPLMGTVTGSGCMLGGLLAAAVACDNSLQAVVDMVDLYGSAGKAAALRMGPLDGNGSYRAYLLDAVYNL